MGGKNGKRVDPYKQRADETHLQWRARIAALDDRKASARQSLVTPEAASHGKYEEGWTDLDGQRARVVINRGGSTIERWLNSPACDVLGDSERSAIRYCQQLWARIGLKSHPVFVVDNGAEGMAEQEALTELACFKWKLPAKHWSLFENICRFDAPAHDRHSKVAVGFVAGMIGMWKGL